MGALVEGAKDIAKGVGETYGLGGDDNREGSKLEKNNSEAAAQKKKLDEQLAKQKAEALAKKREISREQARSMRSSYSLLNVPTDERKPSDTLG